MLTFNIQADCQMPIYEQLYNYIKTEIQTGNMTYNTKLPSKRKLATHLGISQNTIQAAYNQLIEEGYIFSRERSGYFISQIDNIINLTTAQTLPDTASATAKQQITYDFSYRGVDMANFPFSIWRKLAKEAWNEYDTDLLTGGDSLGHINLRENIAKYLHQSRGVNCTADQIVISSGTESLFQILLQLFDSNDVYGIENPGYEKLYKLLPSNDIQFKAIAVDNEGMMLPAIRASGANILCLTPAHQFPTGQIMPINRKAQILNWANEQSDRFIVEDDYDSEFKYSGKPMPALQGLDSNGKVIYMGSFSKALAPSLRVSYMVLPQPLLKQYLERLSYIICPVPTVMQKMLCQFIEAGYFERHLNKMRNLYKRKRELLVNSITALNWPVTIQGADAGLHLLLAVNNGMTEAQLIETALANGAGIYGVSEYYYGYTNHCQTPTLVIGYATMPLAEIEAAIKVLHQSWQPQV